MAIPESFRNVRGIATPVWGLVRDDSSFASKRFNGRTREWLHIDIPAPGPCSASFTVPIFTKQGSLTGYLSLLFPSQPLHHTKIL